MKDDNIIEAVPQGPPNSVRRFLEAVRVYDVSGEKIRIGNPHDGGYVAIREICEQTRVVYCFGIGNDVGFEKDFAERFQPAQLYLFDSTIPDIPEEHPCFSFTSMAAQDWQGPCSRDAALLKVDIEYDEWDFFLSLHERNLRQFSQIMVEFHLVHAEPREGLTPYFQNFYQQALNQVNERLFVLYRNVMVRLREHFFCFHIHANNSLPLISVGGHAFPPLIEMSFVRKNLAGEVKPSAQSFPIRGLDAPNKMDRPDLLNIYPLGGIAWA